MWIERVNSCQRQTIAPVIVTVGCKGFPVVVVGTSLVAQTVKDPPATQTSV